MNKKSSTSIVVQNIYKYYRLKDSKLDSLKSIARYINDPVISIDVLKNWSCGRSTPSLHQLELLGYYMSIHPSQLVIEELEFSLDRTPIWKDNIVEIFYLNFEKYNRQRKDFPKYFDEEFMSYRSYRETLITKKSSISLEKIDKIAKILSVETATIMEETNEKKD
ncbi:hypothetical protein [Streptococcus salivarius]|uniref:hypothetical protein n=1 Tax=Streptococcus salivarius TaxID=1304 RepID=UPI0009394E63|nr:hypothetical protein [Streptococcus salivarius]